MKNRKYSQLDDNTVRVLKISKKALFEFIYENMLGEQESFLDVNCLDVANVFDINF